MMKNLIKILENLSRYFYETRGAGHTRVMIEGAKTEPVILVTHTQDYGEGLRQHNKDLVVMSLSQLGNVTGVLRGIRLPLVIDNSALMQIFNRCLEVLADPPEREVDRVREEFFKERAKRVEAEQELGYLKQIVFAMIGGAIIPAESEEGADD